jgi:crotonobetainyl-CoA:carnitine CoA-transferase CaiB-like acyl-CoA transferase
MSRILAAPWAAQMLADLGAEVIKVERPRVGDDCRYYGPSFLKDSQGNNSQESSFFLSANRNKKSSTVDLSKPTGQDLVRSLAQKCDVLIENYKVGDLKRYGLDYDSLRAINPKLVYCSVTGFGQNGPYATRPGYDSIFQGMSGLMSVTGLPDDVPGGCPMKAGPSLADLLAGQFAVSAIMAALYHRDMHSGKGQYIDVSLLDSAVAAMSHMANDYLLSGELQQRRGTEGNGGMPSRMYRCADQDIMVMAGNQDQFVRLCDVLGCPESVEIPEFKTSSLRGLNRKYLAQVMEPLFAKRKGAELLAALEKASVPAGPINNLRQVFEDPQILARGMAVEVAHPLASNGRLRMVGNPVKYSETPIDQYRTPPKLGEHTRDVLAQVLGLQESAIEALAVEQVI